MVTALTALAFATAACGAPPATTTSTPAPPSASARLIKVPDVSGMNHQDAQNAMQRAGLYNLREVDGTGQGRALVIDRNWRQTGQDPAAGTEVPPDTVITLTAVKYTDR
ncbi:PASTA domain-containing protein [Amycolatopsis sp. Hca4]|uniref:PASTA domain-containing protein n=1 Tax=unclassified Amycolatopsis TaxID=2618356 RepID=UPI001590879A|nr:PASTA domain-containing protein [Amycolatopsis sp. Hca4]